MRPDTQQLIDGLVDELEPVNPYRFSRGLTLALAGMALALALVVALAGLRPDLAAGRPDTMFLIPAGLFLLLGLSCAVTVVTMGSPHVGNRTGNALEGWRWAAAMVALLPLSAIVLLISHPYSAAAANEAEHGIYCCTYSTLLGLMTAAALVFWLRRGAPTSPERAGLLTGIAAGCAGTFAFSFTCPFDGIVHIGLWHGGAVVLSALLGRLIVPRLIRW